MTDPTPEKIAEKMVEAAFDYLRCDVNGTEGAVIEAVRAVVAAETERQAGFRIAVYEELGPMRQTLIEADVCVGLLVSCIKNGESWKPEYEKALALYRDARAALHTGAAHAPGAGEPDIQGGVMAEPTLEERAKEVGLCVSIERERPTVEYAAREEISAAVAAETERCAKIADKNLHHKWIARAIRQGAPEPSEPNDD